MLIQNQNSTEDIGQFVRQSLNKGNGNCSNEDFEKVVKIFEKCSNGIPDYTYFTDASGNSSYGFYYGYLQLEKYDADPRAFYDLLEIDNRIGWSNPNHIEHHIFVYKAIKIIKDQKVSLKIKTFFSSTKNEKL